MIIVNACPICLVAEEAVDHLMLNCACARMLWFSVLQWFGCYWPLPNSLAQLFKYWRLGVGYQKGEDHVEAFFFGGDLDNLEGK